MPRPSNPPFTLGRISTKPHPTLTGQVQARGYYNNADGKRHEVTASGKSDAAARRALQGKVNAARDEFRGGDDTLAHDTRLAQAAEVWLDWKRRQRVKGKTLKAQTLYDYEGYVRRCIVGSTLADLPLSKANDVSRIESWLTRIADERGETAAKQARKVLGGVLQLAERRGAIPASVMHRVQMPGAKAGTAGDRKCVTEDCDYECGQRHLDTRRAFTPEEVSAVMAQAEASAADVADLVAFLFGTGARISEALHCVSWVNVDFDAHTVRVRGTKTSNADRVLSLSDELTERLRQRAALHGTKGLVFGVTRYAGKAGQPRDRNNVCKSLRRVFGEAGVKWAGTHTFRRTVATWLDAAGAALAEIANQLGHGDTNVTATYLGRTTTPTRAAAVMVMPTTSRVLQAV
jgi:integrase